MVEALQVFKRLLLSTNPQQLLTHSRLYKFASRIINTLTAYGEPTVHTHQVKNDLPDPAVRAESRSETCQHAPAKTALSENLIKKKVIHGH